MKQNNKICQAIFFVKRHVRQWHLSISTVSSHQPGGALLEKLFNCWGQSCVCRRYPCICQTLEKNTSLNKTNKTTIGRRESNKWLVSWDRSAKLFFFFFHLYNPAVMTPQWPQSSFSLFFFQWPFNTWPQLTQFFFIVFVCIEHMRRKKNI